LHDEDYTAAKLGRKRSFGFSANSNNQSHNFVERSATNHSSIQKESLMRKSTIFISAVLTTFALVMLYNVVSAYRSNQAINVTEAPAQPTSTLAPEPTNEPAPTKVSLSAVEAAQLATQVVGNTDLLSAESSNINGVDAYKITFTNNDVVYVGLDGQVLSVQVAPVVVNVALPEKHKKKNNDTHISSGSGESHASSEDHED
jgi:hypothetical protein